VYLPDLPLVLGEGSPVNHDRVLALAGELGLDTIDLFPDFEKHPYRRSLFPYEEGRHLVRTLGLHYNADGHRLVARRVIETLQKYEGRSVRRSTGNLNQGDVSTNALRLDRNHRR